jgi:hypothetical protein
MFNKIKGKISHVVDGIRFGLPAKITACAVVGTLPFSAFAATDPTKKIIGTVLGVVCNVFLYVGVFFLVTGVASLISALKQEDADRQQKAITSIVIAVTMIGIKLLLGPILTATGTGITIS